MIKDFDAAVEAANELSDNLYYEDNFTPECFRVFLDSLPTIFRATVQVSYNYENKINGLVTIVFVSREKRCISIVIKRSWIYFTYFRHFRKIPFSVHIDFPNPWDNPVPR